MNRYLAFLAGLLIASIIIACSGGDAAETAPTPTPSLAPVNEASPTPAPVETAPTPGSSQAVSVAQLMELGEQVFPSALPSGVYGVCGASGDVEACPFTDHLRTRLKEAGATLCRCQNPSTTRVMSAEPADFGGVLYVVLYEGTQTYMLTIINRNGQLLVDDASCHGGGPDTSIYKTVAPCRSP